MRYGRVKYIEKVDFRYLNYKSFMNSVIGQELLRLTQEIEDLAVGAIVHQKKSYPYYTTPTRIL